MKRKMVAIPLRTPFAPPASSLVSPSLKPTRLDVGTTEEQPSEQVPASSEIATPLDNSHYTDTDEPPVATNDASSQSSPTAPTRPQTPAASPVSSESRPSLALASCDVVASVSRDDPSITVATDLAVSASCASAGASSAPHHVDGLQGYEDFVFSLPRSLSSENGAVPDALAVVRPVQGSLPLLLETAQDGICSRSETGGDVAASYPLPSWSVPASSDQWTPPDMPHVAPDSSLLLHPDTPDLTASWSMTTASSGFLNSTTRLAFEEPQPSYMDEDQPADDDMAFIDSPVGSSSMDIDSDDLYTPQFGGNGPTDLVLFEDNGSRSPSMAMDDVLPFYTSMLPKTHWNATPEPPSVAMDTYSAPSSPTPGHLLDWQSTLAPATCSPLSHLLGLPFPFAPTVPPQTQSLTSASLGSSSPDLLPPIELVSTGPSRSRVSNRHRLLPYDANLRRGRRSAPQVPDYEVFFGRSSSEQVHEDDSVQQSEEPLDAPDRGRRSAAPSPGRQLFFIDPPETQASSFVEGATPEEASELQVSANAADSLSTDVTSLENTSAQIELLESSSTPLTFHLDNDDPERDADDEHEESDTEAPESATRATTPRLVIKLSAQSIQSTMVKIDREKAVEQATLDALDNLTLTRDTGAPSVSGSDAHP
ncbi:hypothetical protein EIP91_010163 [Steccherinum ochraceum]|uniref:Uncharacterized protein n=1 Tax=Steccherinum ochraceum TaxID=92696 RepID=A0A4V2MXT8_9APHY|nr:hypothetical protein EIP91_010163 [Steccherinum ochraceum]